MTSGVSAPATVSHSVSRSTASMLFRSDSRKSRRGLLERRGAALDRRGRVGLRGGAQRGGLALGGGDDAGGALLRLLDDARGLRLGALHALCPDAVQKTLELFGHLRSLTLLTTYRSSYTKFHPEVNSRGPPPAKDDQTLRRPVRDCNTPPGRRGRGVEPRRLETGHVRC